VEPEEDPLVLVEAAAVVEVLAELVEPEVAALEEVAELVEASLVALVEELASAEVEVEARPLVDAAGSWVGAWVWALWWWDLQAALVLTREPGVTLTKASLTVTCSPSEDVKRNDKGVVNPLAERAAECQYPQAALWDISVQSEEPASCISTATVSSSSSLGSTANHQELLLSNTWS
jgi:hypothetical protein